MIRAINQKDLETIALYEKSFNHNDRYTYTQLSQMFYNPNFVIACYEAHEKIIGYCIVTVTSETLDINKIYIAQQYRKNGYGKELLLYFRKKYSDKSIFVEVASNNLTAITFYKNLNFKPISERKNYYAQNVDAIIMKS
ncbi:MAG: GNAT family N-acetyltransferase [Mycoplasmataceae bacterium]|jgi:ribosomal-protein-alanine N-acetyltransferase|nr:GNAT family N-acetyltransferase [Mycoplasmataceae bacterium]